MKIDILRKFKKILILGYGLEGKSAKKFIKSVHKKAQIGIADIKEGKNYLLKQENYDLVVRSPSIHPKNILKPYTTSTNLFLHNVKGTVIGVTGTKGKSTTASLIYHILKKAGKKTFLCGNIGTPCLSVLEKNNDPNTIYVAEFSSYQLIDATKSPSYSILLNLYVEHTDYHGSMYRYFLAKTNISNYQKMGDVLIINKPNILDQCGSSKEINDLLNRAFLSRKDAIDYTAVVLPHGLKTNLIGEHNIGNLQSVYALLKIMDISDSMFMRAAKSFLPLKHRLEYIGTYRNIIFYNDAISTTPESTMCAIQALKSVGSILLGGMDRGYDFRKLVSLIQKMNIPNIVLFPDSGDKIKKSFSKQYIKKTNLLSTKSMEQAIIFCYEKTPPGTICLLSCASPSFSLWRDYKHKGEEFVYYVKKYATEKKETSLS